MFTLFNVVFVVVTMLLDILLFGATPDNPTSPRYLTTLYGLFVFLPTLTVVVRRLHDMALTGVGFAVLMITAVWMIVWMCFDSQAGENKYGPNPKQIAAPVESAAPAAAAEPSEPETPKAE